MSSEIAHIDSALIVVANPPKAPRLPAPISSKSLSHRLTLLGSYRRYYSVSSTLIPPSVLSTTNQSCFIDHSVTAESDFQPFQRNPPSLTAQSPSTPSRPSVLRSQFKLEDLSLFPVLSTIRSFGLEIHYRVDIFIASWHTLRSTVYILDRLARFVYIDSTLFSFWTGLSGQLPPSAHWLHLDNHLLTHPSLPR